MSKEAEDGGGTTKVSNPSCEHKEETGGMLPPVVAGGTIVSPPAKSFDGRQGARVNPKTLLLPYSHGTTTTSNSSQEKILAQQLRHQQSLPLQSTLESGHASLTGRKYTPASTARDNRLLIQRRKLGLDEYY